MKTLQVHVAQAKLKGRTRPHIERAARTWSNAGSTLCTNKTCKIFKKRNVMSLKHLFQPEFLKSIMAWGMASQIGIIQGNMAAKTLQVHLAQAPASGNMQAKL